MLCLPLFIITKDESGMDQATCGWDRGNETNLVTLVKLEGISLTNMQHTELTVLPYFKSSHGHLEPCILHSAKRRVGHALISQLTAFFRWFCGILKRNSAFGELVVASNEAASVLRNLDSMHMFPLRSCKQMVVYVCKDGCSLSWLILMLCEVMQVLIDL